jgi:inorganic phosphate transporter, PiT family
MPEHLALLVIVIVAAVGFGVVNGLNDAANAVAASIGSHSLPPRVAFIIAAFCNLAGAATGLEVARTIGKGILVPEAVSFLTLVAALVTVIIWGALATRAGLPISITHSFVVGLAGAGMAVAGTEAIQWHVMKPVLSSVVVAPVVGFVGGFVLMVVLLWLFRHSAPAKMRVIFSRLQIFTTAFLAYSHGKNDGQMPIGVITMALVIYTGKSELWDNIPLWVIILSALAISSGTFVGGWRVVRTVGVKLTTLQPIHGFASDASAATIIEVASHFGIPVSTTHCVTSAIMGVGATRHFSAVRWGVTRTIVLTWILTFPACGVGGWLIASFMAAVL